MPRAGRAGSTRARAGGARRGGADLDDDALDDPSNLAIAFHPEFVYGAYEHDGRVVFIAEDLAAKVFAAAKKECGEAIAGHGGGLDGLRFTHPLYDRTSLAVLADYVTLEQGTGAVHTAPGHGSDDYLTGVKYGLEIYAPIGPDGRFTDEVGLFAGEQVFEANPAWSRRSPSADGCGTSSRSSTPTRIAGDATTR